MEEPVKTRVIDGVKYRGRATFDPGSTDVSIALLDPETGGVWARAVQVGPDRRQTFETFGRPVPLPATAWLLQWSGCF